MKIIAHNLIKRIMMFLFPCFFFCTFYTIGAKYFSQKSMIFRISNLTTNPGILSNFHFKCSVVLIIKGQEVIISIMMWTDWLFLYKTCNIFITLTTQAYTWMGKFVKKCKVFLISKYCFPTKSQKLPFMIFPILINWISQLFLQG